MPIRLTTTAFKPDGPIPKRYSGDGKDVSPPLAWTGVPEGAAALALVCDDPDAPTPEPWVHWVIYGIDPKTTALPEGVPHDATLTHPLSAMQGQNSWKTVGYRGPAPPRGHGTHHYHFRLYALKKAPAWPPGLSKNALLELVHPHLLCDGELVGTYER